jgi:hypothetical protein
VGDRHGAAGSLRDDRAACPIIAQALRLPLFAAREGA